MGIFVKIFHTAFSKTLRDVRNLTTPLNSAHQNL